MYYFLAAITLFIVITLLIILVRITILTVRYMKWRKFSVPAVGTVGELKDVNCIYGRGDQVTSYRYDYAFKIICGDQEFDAVYSEECQPGDMPITQPGNKINILWLASEQKYLNASDFLTEFQQITKQAVMFTGKIVLRALSRRGFR